MPGRIVVFGATGYTGRLTCEALVDRGEKPVLAARNESRLSALASALGGGLETVTADVERPDTVRALVERGDVLVATVGPFAKFGRPAADAAIAAGASYLDSTGEPAFIRQVFERFGPAASYAMATACEPVLARAAASGPPVDPFTTREARKSTPGLMPGTFSTAEVTAEKTCMARLSESNQPRYARTSRSCGATCGRAKCSEAPIEMAARSRPRTGKERVRAAPRSVTIRPPW